MCRIIQAIVASKMYYSCNLFDRVTLRMEELSIIELTFMRVVRSTIFSLNYCLIFRKNNLKFILKHLDVFFIFVQICELLIPRLNLFDLSSERELYFVSLSCVMTVKYAVYRKGGLLISFIKKLPHIKIYEAVIRILIIKTY